jgi:hypothetical protein
MKGSKCRVLGWRQFVFWDGDDLRFHYAEIGKCGAVKVRTNLPIRTVIGYFMNVLGRKCMKY